MIDLTSSHWGYQSYGSGVGLHFLLSFVLHFFASISMFRRYHFLMIDLHQNYTIILSRIFYCCF